MDRNSTIILEIFNHIADGRDGTLDTLGYDLPLTGYFVGGRGEALVFESTEDANRSASLRKIGEFVEGTEARYVGWWTDSETGKVYVDGTDWFASEYAAGRSARERKEIAFWDIERERELRVAYVEGEV